MAQSASRADAIARWHAWTGALPLVVFLWVHLWEQWQALAGPTGLVLRRGDAPPSTLRWTLLALFVAVPLVLHVVLGVVRIASREGQGAGGYATRGLRWLQRISGLAALAFVVVHVAQLSVPAFTQRLSPPFLYSIAREELGRLPYFALYLVGIVAVVFHAAHGLLATFRRMGWTRDGEGARFAHVVVGSLAFALVVGYANVLAYYVRGEAFFGEPKVERPARPEAPTQPRIERAKRPGAQLLRLNTRPPLRRGDNTSAVDPGGESAPSLAPRDEAPAPTAP